MSTYTIYSATGAGKSNADLPVDFFAAPINEALMHRAVVMRLHNKRNPIAHTKTRANVAATRKKAFRQKGTGNARRGSLTTNLLRGGGVVHGPLSKSSFNKRMNKKERRAALKSSLTSRAEHVFGISAIDAYNTKAIASIMKQAEAKKTLFVFDQAEGVVGPASVRNIANVKYVYAGYLNPYDVLWADHLCFVGNGLQAMLNHFSS